jgi:oligoribonuclease NrnB/cAMP/cGMP phosphodiesterase (DHH superfamily)
MSEDLFDNFNKELILKKRDEIHELIKNKVLEKYYPNLVLYIQKRIVEKINNGEEKLKLYTDVSKNRHGI